MSPEVIVAGKGLAAYNFSAEYAEKSPDATVHVLGQEYSSPRSWFALGSRMPSEAMNAIGRNEIKTHELTGTRFAFFEGGSVASDVSIDLKGELPSGSCLMIDDADLKRFYKEKLSAYSSVVLHEGGVVSARSNDGLIRVETSIGEQIEGQIAVDASGSFSELQRKHEPKLIDDDPMVVWIHGYRVEGEFDPNTMIFPLKDVSTGRLSWIAPWSDGVADVLASDYCRLSEYKQKTEELEETYSRFAQLSEDNNLCVIRDRGERITGKIRVVPIRRPGYEQRIFPVGDAAGQACPNMAEGITTALHQSRILADALHDNSSLTPQEYFNMWRKGETAEYPYNLQLSFLVNRLRHEQAGQNRAIYEAIVRHGSTEDKLRLLTNRSIGVSDISFIATAIRSNPQILALVARHFGTAALFKLIPGVFDQALYGEGDRK